MPATGVELRLPELGNDDGDTQHRWRDLNYPWYSVGHQKAQCRQERIKCPKFLERSRGFRPNHEPAGLANRRPVDPNQPIRSEKEEQKEREEGAPHHSPINFQRASLCLFELANLTKAWKRKTPVAHVWISRVFHFFLRTFEKVEAQPGPLAASDETYPQCKFDISGSNETMQNALAPMV